MTHGGKHRKHPTPSGCPHRSLRSMQEVQIKITGSNSVPFILQQKKKAETLTDADFPPPHFLPCPLIVPPSSRPPLDAMWDLWWRDSPVFPDSSRAN